MGGVSRSRLQVRATRSGILTAAGALISSILAACGPSSPTAGAAHGSAPATSSPIAPIESSASPSSLVDPFMGTGVGGTSVGQIDTFPGADMPFGMLQWSPDTSPDRSPGGGYSYKDSAISGFSLTHMSGPGCPVYGDIPILPVAGALPSRPAAATASFSHSTEAAHPGSYSVAIGHPPVQVALGVTTRSGLGVFTFPGTTDGQVLFKVADSANGSGASDAEIVGDREVDGTVESGGFCGTGGTYYLHFAAIFDTPFSSFGTWHGTKVVRQSRSSSYSGSGGYVTFGGRPRTVEMQVGISFVSVADARSNIQAEDPGWSIDQLEQRNTGTWNSLLGRISVSGGTPASERTFYSALYHSLLEPNVFDDANGEFVGFDGKVHVANGYTQYTNFSEWDIYRSEIPLLTLLVPRQTSDMVTSLLTDASQGEGLPKWAVASSDAAQQNGDSADPIIASAYAFGARDFDVDAALADMIKGATDPSIMNGEFPERQDLAAYMTNGYVEAGRHDITSLDYTVGGSETLEYAIDDFAISQLADAVGDTSASDTFLSRAQNWQHLADPATGYLAARRADGTLPPGPAFQPSSQADVGQVGWEEGNAVQYTWSVPQNLRGLFAAIGGNPAVVGKLNRFFTQLNAGRKQPYDWAGNEPSLGTPWEYDYAGAPWLTQSTVRRIESLYSATPDGEPGNDDLGALSSWYVWAAMGMYPEVPGRGELVLGSPLFPHVSVALADGRSMVLNAALASSTSPYVQMLQVHGLAGAPGACSAGPPDQASQYDCSWLPASATMSGAVLDFDLSRTPNRTWASSPSEAPPSFSAS